MHPSAFYDAHILFFSFALAAESVFFVVFIINTDVFVTPPVVDMDNGNSSDDSSDGTDIASSMISMIFGLISSLCGSVDAVAVAAAAAGQAAANAVTVVAAADAAATRLLFLDESSYIAAWNTSFI